MMIMYLIHGNVGKNLVCIFKVITFVFDNEK